MLPHRGCRQATVTAFAGGGVTADAADGFLGAGTAGKLRRCVWQSRTARPRHRAGVILPVKHRRATVEHRDRSTTVNATQTSTG